MAAEAHELTAAYALDALDPEEREAFERHLAHCERCQEELASMWQTTDALAAAASGPEPRPDLRERILSAARAEPHVVVPLTSRRDRAVPALATAAALAAAVALAVGAWGASVSSDLDEARSALERERAAASVLADPDARSISLQTGDGRLVVGPDGRGVLVVDGLEAAPAGKTYEAWVVAHGEDPQPAGLFSGAEERDVVLLDEPVRAGQVVLVTIERAGGVEAPTTDPILGSQPA